MLISCIASFLGAFITSSILSRQSIKKMPPVITDQDIANYKKVIEDIRRDIKPRRK